MITTYQSTPLGAVTWVYAQDVPDEQPAHDETVPVITGINKMNERCVALCSPEQLQHNAELDQEAEQKQQTGGSSSTSTDSGKNENRGGGSPFDFLTHPGDLLKSIGPDAFTSFFDNFTQGISRPFTEGAKAFEQAEWNIVTGTAKEATIDNQYVGDLFWLMLAYASYFFIPRLLMIAPGVMRRARSGRYLVYVIKSVGWMILALALMGTAFTLWLPTVLDMNNQAITDSGVENVREMVFNGFGDVPIPILGGILNFLGGIVQLLFLLVCVIRVIGIDILIGGIPFAALAITLTKTRALGIVYFILLIVLILVQYPMVQILELVLKIGGSFGPFAPVARLVGVALAAWLVFVAPKILLYIFKSGQTVNVKVTTVVESTRGMAASALGEDM